MKPGSRSLGIAFSDGETTSRIAGAVVRADGLLDGLAFGTCTVGGTDATAAVIDLLDRLDRDDVRRLLCAGVAPAWYNVVDIGAVYAAADCPVVAVSFEASDGLEPALREQFAGDALARRLAAYRALPERRRVEVGGGELFVRAAGIDDTEAARLVRELTRRGDRPEPLRAARLAARARRAEAEQ